MPSIHYHVDQLVVNKFNFDRIPDGLRELRTLLEQHITNQGLAAIDRCGETAVNVRTYPVFGFPF